MVSASRRPTGYSRRRDRTSSTTVGLPCVSRAVETTPAGLFSACTSRGSGSTRRPSSSTSVRLVHVPCRVGDHLAVDRHPAVAHDLLGRPPRGHARVREELAEPHGWRLRARALLDRAQVAVRARLAALLRVHRVVGAGQHLVRRAEVAEERDSDARRQRAGGRGHVGPDRGAEEVGQLGGLAGSPPTGISTANSSPPNRATMSLSRSLWFSTTATAVSTRSPARWPNSSFTRLKSSRSSRSSAPSIP